MLIFLGVIAATSHTCADGKTNCMRSAEIVHLSACCRCLTIYDCLHWELRRVLVLLDIEM